MAAARKTTAPSARARPARAAVRAGSGAADGRWRLSQLRALAHPLRLRLYELFAEKPLTTMQAAALIGEPPTRLYHHVNLLEKAGLVRLRETRPNRGTVEKYFEVVTHAFKGAGREALMEKGRIAPHTRALAAVVFEQARRELLASIGAPRRAGDPPLLAVRLVLVDSPARVRSVHARVMALLKQIQRECDAPTSARESRQAREQSSPEHERWSLTVAFTPSWPRARQRKR